MDATSKNNPDPEKLRAELKRINNLDMRDGYVDEPVAILIELLKNIVNHDDLLNEALYIQACAKVYQQSPAELLTLCDALLLRLESNKNMLLFIKTQHLKVAAYCQLNKKEHAREILEMIIDRCLSIDDEAFKKEVVIANVKYAELQDDKIQSIIAYQAAIEKFENDPNEMIRERIAYALHQKALLQFAIGDDPQARMTLKKLCAREVAENTLSTLWIDRAKHRLTIKPII